VRVRIPAREVILASGEPSGLSLHNALAGTVSALHVDESVDHGPIILQAAVAIAPEDDVDTVTARILEVEHQLYPAAIRLFAEDRLRIDGRRVVIDGTPAPLPPPLLPLPKSSIGA